MVTRRQTIAAVAAAVAIGAVAAHVTVKFPNTRPLGDAIKDWLTVAAVVGDGHPTDSLNDLARIYFDASGPPEAHPRTPGGLLLQMPMALGDWRLASNAVAVSVIVSTVFVAWAITQLCRLRWWWLPVVAGLMFFSSPIAAAFGVGGQGPLVAALIAATWLLVRRRDTLSAGVPLGVAATLKMFPGLLIPVLWLQGRKRAAVGAAATVAGLNLAGLMLPDVTLVDQLRTLLLENHAPNPANLSPGLPVAVAAVGVIAVLAVSRRLSLDGAFTAGSVAMLVFSPVVWHHYLLALAVPVAVFGLWVVGQVSGDLPRRQDASDSAVVVPDEPSDLIGPA